MSNSYKSLFLISYILLVFSSCTPLKKMVMFNRDVSINSELFKKQQEYTIEEGDYLSVHLQGVEFENYQFLIPNYRSNIKDNASPYEKGVVVSNKGEIDLPFLGVIGVKGFTLLQLQDTLESKYEDYIKTPNVTVKLLNFNVSIIGQVKKPGPVKANGESITLLDALSKSGGPNIDGNRVKTILIRKINGENVKFKLDLTSKELAFPNIVYLQKGDVIYVPPTRRSYLTKELQFVNITISGLASILTLYILLKRI